MHRTVHTYLSLALLMLIGTIVLMWELADPGEIEAGSTSNVILTGYAYGNYIGAGWPDPVEWGQVAVHTGYTPNVGTTVYFDSPLPLVDWHDQLSWRSSAYINDHGDPQNRMPWDWMDLYHGRWYLPPFYSGCEGRCTAGDGPCEFYCYVFAVCLFSGISFQ